MDGSVAEATARLWPQTERLRAYLIDRQDGDAARLGEPSKVSLAISTRRCPDYGTKTSLPTVASLLKPHRRQAFIILSEPLPNFGLPAGRPRLSPLIRIKREK